MNSFTNFRQYSYKRLFVLVAASLPAFAALAQEQEPANPRVLGRRLPSQELAAAGFTSETSAGLLASTGPTAPAQLRYEEPTDLPLPLGSNTPDTLKTKPMAPAEGFHNAVRFDMGGVLASNFANTALGNGGALFPFLASYERQVGNRFSVVGEGLLNGGSSSERKAGVSVQGRYYFRPQRGTQALAGFYLAPAAAFRSVKLSGRYEPTQQRRFVGAGALLGWQGSFKSGSRFFLDVSAGLMNWQHVGQDKFKAAPYGGYQTEQKAYYDTHQTDFDGRLGLGFRF